MGSVKAASLPEMEPSRLNYAAAIAKIHASRDQHVASVNRTYADRLSELARQLTGSDETDLARAVHRERARLAKGLDPTPAERRAMTGLLLIQRVTYEKQRSMETMGDDKLESQTDLAWMDALKQWRTYYLKAGQTPKAELVQAEIERLATPKPKGAAPAGVPPMAPTMPPLAGDSATGKGAGAPSSPEPPMARPIKLTNSTTAAEAEEVLSGAMNHDSALFSSIQELELVKVHDFASGPMNHHSGDAEKVEGAHAENAIVSSAGGIGIWGPYEKLETGRYFVVYRVRLFDETKGEACFLDVAHKGVTASGAHPKGAEVPPGAWHDIALPLEVDHPKDFEYRLWGSKHRMAMDRVYIYRVKMAS
jgi:hypothetical protein